MATKAHQKAVYYTNRALEAYSISKTATLEKYAGLLAGHRGANDLHWGYRLYINALLESDRAQRSERLREAYDTFLNSDALREAAVVLLDFGCARGFGEPALAAALEALKLFERAGDDIGCSKALINAGVNYLHLQQYGDAIRSSLRCLKIQQSKTDNVGMGITCLNLAGCYLYMGENARSLCYAQESISCFERNSMLAESGSADAGGYVWQTNGWKRTNGDTSQFLANACVNYGNAADALGDHEGAIGALVRANNLMTGAGNLAGKAMVLNQIGQILLDQEEPVRAEENFRDSVKLFEESHTTGYMYAVALQSLGQAYSAQRRFTEAISYYSRSLAEFAKVKHRAGEAETLLMLGEVAIGQFDNDRAVQLLENALNIARTVSALDLVVRCNRALGAAMKHIDSAKAREHLLLALLLAEEQNMKLEQQNIHRELSAYYKLIGESTDALSHFEKFYSLQREIHTEDANRRLLNVEILHKVDQYRHSLYEMERKVQEIESQLDQKTRELAGLAVRIMEKQEFVKLVEKGLNRILKAQSDRKDDMARDLLGTIREAGDAQSDWQDLIRRFLSVHHEFAERLIRAAPGLTPTEFQVCVLLRLSMGAKQIAEVLNIEPKTVFNHQQSVRRKLNLQNRENLKRHLIHFEPLAIAQMVTDQVKEV